MIIFEVSCRPLDFSTPGLHFRVNIAQTTMRHYAYASARQQAGIVHDIEGAENEQKRIAAQVIIPSTDQVLPRTVAGLDVSYAIDSDRVVAAAVVVDYETGAILEERTLEGRATFPYVPGLLAFREVPLLLDVLGSLSTKPDLLLCDGQGLAHPARCGLACHLGVLLDIPSIGSAKSHYVGAYEEPGTGRGSRCPLTDNGDVVGHVLRTQTGVNTIFVSPGHRIGHQQTCDIVLHLATTHRIPDPVRYADQISRKVLREVAHPLLETNAT